MAIAAIPVAIRASGPRSCRLPAFVPLSPKAPGTYHQGLPPAPGGVGAQLPLADRHPME
jgi:hypothetical protein